jgi:hypothetical protein
MSTSSPASLLALTLDELKKIKYTSAPWHSSREASRSAAEKRYTANLLHATTEDNYIDKSIIEYAKRYEYCTGYVGSDLIYTLPPDGDADLNLARKQMQNMLVAEAHMMYFRTHSCARIPDSVLSFVFGGVAADDDSLHKKFQVATVVCAYLVMDEFTTRYVFSIIHRDERASYRDALARAIKRIEDGDENAAVATDSLRILRMLRFISDRANEIFDIEDTAETERIGDPSMIDRIKKAEHASRKRVNAADD